ncbi:hypothetical protein SYK_13960 [Pseudodesulfovibrio nedwellii]|uniref:YqzM family protein n=1 Tax=Pseudodesulfovibrio nedwellii TaxID=2973072 RepID=A0ABM8AZS1_9BACT|nr:MULTISPECIES: hypothetical protein [Pseudodesulfovibrio]BDQ37036.1 hypothetical protein SYK_13960 [Pseudodesulfovibrio nedwellii]
MKRHMHTTDETGFNYMDNKGQEEQDRDSLGVIFALAIMAIITISQYMGML